MAVGDRLPVVTHLSASSTKSSAVSSRVTGRRHPTQVATDNSSTFIQFLTNSRQSSPFIPTYRSRTSCSSTRPFSVTLDTQSISNNSKASNTPSSNSANIDRKRSHSQQRFNPILNNPLLNHRKQQPKSLPVKISTEFSNTIRLCLTPESLAIESHDNQVPPISATIVPHVTHQTEISAPDGQIIPDVHENSHEEEIPYLDKNKYDYITSWLREVHPLTSSTKTFSKTKRSKKRFVPS